MTANLWPLLLACACLVWLAGSPVWAQNQARLLSIAKYPGLNSTMLSLQMSEATKFEVSPSGQKVNVVLTNAAKGENFQPLPADGDIVDTLVARQENNLVVSILLRRPPSRVESMTLGQKEIQVDLHWEGINRQTRPALSREPEGVLTMLSQGAVVGRYLTSPFAGQWRRFFSQYEPQVEVEPSLHFTRMPYPVAVQDPWETDMPRTALDRAAQGRWRQAVRLANQAGKNGAGKSPGLRAELMLRAGQVSSATSLLHELFEAADDPGQLPGRLHLLRAYTLLAADRPYLAYCHAFSDAQPEPENMDPEAAQYWGLLRVELALATGRPEQAVKLAAKQSASFQSVQLGLRVRRLQAMLALDQRMQAWELFRQHTLSPNQIRGMPQAMADMADLLYEHERFAQARIFYTQLAAALSPSQEKALVLWRAGMCHWRNGQKKQALDGLRMVRHDYPQTPGGYRARLSLNDMAVLADLPEITQEQVTEYNLIADKAPERLIREEASLKAIVALYQRGELQKAVHHLSQFLIHFAGGPLRTEGQVLLGEMVPRLVRLLFEQGQIVKGLAYVAEHRDILVRTDLPQNFLYAMGDVFTELGLYERASRIYLYMLSRAQGGEKKGELYTRLIRLWSEEGFSEQMLEYAESYIEKYPQGAYRREILALSTQALLQEGMAERALDYLLDSSRPVSRELDIHTARALHGVQAYARMDRYLLRASMPQASLPADVRFQWARAKSKQGRTKQALALYQSLGQGESSYAQPALYQAGQILADMGRTQEAIKVYTKLSEKGQGSPWADLAAESRFLLQNADQLSVQD